MVTGRRLLSRASWWLYVAVCAAVAVVAIFPSSPSAVAYYGLVLVTLPIGVVAATVTYLGGVLLFGPDPDGILARAVIFVCWIGLVAVQMLVVRALLRTWRGSHPEPSVHEGSEQAVNHSACG